MKKRECILGPKIKPGAISSQTTIRELVDEAFCSFNSGRLREACQLLTRKMLEPDVTIGLSMTGALTPAGLGMSAVIPLIEHGFVDWIISTGANLYHDIHYAIGFDLHTGSPFMDDRKLRQEKIIRIYDILFDYDVLLSTDDFIFQVIKAEEFQTPMSTAEFHFRLGKYVREREKLLGLSRVSLVSAAYKAGVPIYTSSPGDSSIGMNVARAALSGSGPRLDVALDVNETAAIVLNAKRNGKSAVWILGGGSPKNFLLQTEPYIQEILGIEEDGHDYFLQITDARPDTGGLSGATPSEAVSWGKIDPQRLPDAVVCYADVTIALPIITAYAFAAHPPREQRRLYEQREELVRRLAEQNRSQLF
jgi:deoxyhypusine synthase